MSKSLKNFIEENRREFDDDLPSSGVWHQVERSIGATKLQKKYTSGIFISGVLSPLFSYWLFPAFIC